MMADFTQIIGPLARSFFGEPNPAYSSEHELRYGARGSLSVDLRKGTWFDHEAGEGGGALDLVTRELKLTGAERLDWMQSHGFCDAPTNGSTAPRAKIVATYDYVDEGGTLLFQVVRYHPKTFRQRRPDASDPSGWSWSVKDVRRVPYRLPDVIENGDKVVVIVEGERDVDSLWRIGIPATTNAGGAGKWRDELNEFFRGGDVVIVPDRDPQKKHPKTGELMFHADGRPMLPGQDHAIAVASALHGIAARVRVLELWRSWPEMPPKGDVSDWIERGGTAEQLYALIEAMPDWSPKQKKPDSSGIYSVDALRTETFPTLKQIAGDIIVEGLTLLASRPKIGKTWLALDVAIAVDQARYCLGDIQCEQGDVLFLALEDNKRRMQRRLTKLLGINKAAWPRFSCAHTWPRANNGGLDRIRQWIAQHEKTARLVVIDVLARFRKLAPPGKQSYDLDYEAIAELQKIASDTGIAILVIHHTRKGEADDPLDAVSGTLGLAGAADLVLVIDKKADGVRLYGRGRDVDEIDKAMIFNRDTCRWTILGETADVRRSKERQEILDVLAAGPMTLKDIAISYGKSVKTVFTLLEKMAAKGEVTRVSRGVYALATVGNGETVGNDDGKEQPWWKR